MPPRGVWCVWISHRSVRWRGTHRSISQRYVFACNALCLCERKWMWVDVGAVVWVAVEGEVRLKKKRL